MTRASPDIAIVGAGLVGAALAWGCARQGARVLLVDAGEDDLHASAGNFGLVWVQGKGLGAPDYAGLTRRSADAWAAFDADLRCETGISAGYTRTGGLEIALTEAELDEMATEIKRMHNQPAPGASEARMLDRAELQELAPAVGPAALGASYCPHDGVADPLRTHRALAAALAAHPKVEVLRARARRVLPQTDGSFRIETQRGDRTAGRVALTAGLGAVDLAPALGLPAPVRPVRGQILVTERLPRILDIPNVTIRQTGDGTVMLGDSKEDVGFDRGVTPGIARKIVARAAQIYPLLRKARIVRQWGALRVMSPDGKPIYAESRAHPGAALLTCHSGVTLAAAHAGEVAAALLAGRLEQTYPAFTAKRFEPAQ
ncbi:MAG: FAD-dependent oxidoreductase [Pseudomonadota bacterium]